MKKLLIVLVTMITAAVYAQTKDFIEMGNRRYKQILSVAPECEYWDFFVVTTPDGHNMRVITSPNYKHQYATVKYYDIRIPISDLYSPKILVTKYISMNTEFYKVFDNFVPIPGVKRYMSDYSLNPTYDEVLGSFYFAVYKNGVKTYDTDVLTGRVTNRERPIDKDLWLFIQLYLFDAPEKL